MRHTMIASLALLSLAFTLAVSAKTLTNADVEQLLHAKVDPTLILKMVGNEPGSYSLTEQDRERLKAAGATDLLLGVMETRNMSQSATQTSTPVTRTNIQPVRTGSLPTSDGIYLKTSKGYERINQDSPKISGSAYWRKEVKLENATSDSVVENERPTFLIHLSGEAINELNLIKITKVQKDKRYLFSKTNLSFKNSGSVDGLPVEKETIDSNYTLFRPQAALENGEYAFMVLDIIKDKVQAWSFRIQAETKSSANTLAKNDE